MKRLTRSRTGEVRRVSRNPFKPEPTTPYTVSKHTLLERRQTRVGWHEAGEAGAYLHMADGFGTFFPDKGGCIMRLPVSKVKAILKAAPQVVKRPFTVEVQGVRRLTRRR